MNLVAHDDNDEFEKFIRKLNSQRMYRTRDESKISNSNNNNVSVHKLAKRE